MGFYYYSLAIIIKPARKSHLISSLSLFLFLFFSLSLVSLVEKFAQNEIALTGITRVISPDWFIAKYRIQVRFAQSNDVQFNAIPRHVLAVTKKKEDKRKEGMGAIRWRCLHDSFLRPTRCQGDLLLSNTNAHIVYSACPYQKSHTETGIGESTYGGGQPVCIRSIIFYAARQICFP